MRLAPHQGVRLSTRYLVLGLVIGLVAPAGLFFYALLGDRNFDPWELFLVMAAGSALTLSVAGWMIGRRDDALLATNQELRLAGERLRALTVTDPLTGISNRRSFDERLAVEVARRNRYRTPLALVMVDLDHFKQLNDRRGHPAGDAVLRAVASLLNAEKRRGDVVARVGGEEFAAILPHTDAGAAAAWAERVRQRIATTAVDAGGEPLSITASFGVADARGSHATTAGLLAEADRALYAAKAEGRNRVTAARERRRRLRQPL